MPHTVGWISDSASTNRTEIKDIENTIYVSSASAWEISAKFRIGKLPEASSVATNVSEWIIKAGFQPLPITAEHARLAGN